MHRKFITLVTAGGVALAITMGSVAVVVPAASASTAAVTSVHHPLAAARVSAWVRLHRRAITRAVIETSAQTIGITPTALVTALRSGQSLAQIANNHGVQASAVSGALIAKGDARITTLENKGTITAARADRLRARLVRATARVMNKHF